jgi:hypothetical protein
MSFNVFQVCLIEPKRFRKEKKKTGMLLEARLKQVCDSLFAGVI